MREDQDEPPSFHATLAAAHAAGKRAAPVFRPNVHIRQLDVADDKAAVIGYLNQGHENLKAQCSKAWRLSPRGGLVEMPV